MKRLTLMQFLPEQPIYDPTFQASITAKFMPSRPSPTSQLDKRRLESVFQPLISGVDRPYIRKWTNQDKHTDEIKRECAHTIFLPVHSLLFCSRDGCADILFKINPCLFIHSVSRPCYVIYEINALWGYHLPGTCQGYDMTWLHYVMTAKILCWLHVLEIKFCKL